MVGLASQNLADGLELVVGQAECPVQRCIGLRLLGRGWIIDDG